MSPLRILAAVIGVPIGNEILIISDETETSVHVDRGPHLFGKGTDRGLGVSLVGHDVSWPDRARRLTIGRATFAWWGPQKDGAS